MYLGILPRSWEQKDQGETKEMTMSPSQEESVPPGQFVTEKFPVLTFGDIPQVDLAVWQLRIFGLVEREIVLGWKELMALPQVALTADFHCVTQWSRLNNHWEGVLFKNVMALTGVSREAKYVMAHCYGDYTTNLPLEVAMEDDVLLAHHHDGETLTREHGGPLRLVVPKRYAWKSAKWVNGLELMAQDRPGFWEQRGYNNSADPWREERFWDGSG